VEFWPSRIAFMSLRYKEMTEFALNGFHFTLAVPFPTFVRDFPIKLVVNLPTCYLLLMVVINQNAHFQTKSV